MTATDLAPARSSRTIDLTGRSGPFAVYHALVTVTAVNLNADRQGLPKTVVVGDVERMRVSSQALARAARMRMIGDDPQIRGAARSRLLPAMTAERLKDRLADTADAVAAAALIVAAAGMRVAPDDPARTRAVAFVPADAPDRLADLLQEHWNELKDARTAAEEAITEALSRAPRKRNVKVPKDEVLQIPTDQVPDHVTKAAWNAFDPGTTQSIALFGRMLTELDDATVPSSVQIAHAFGVDALDLLLDEFTVHDDWQDGGVLGPRRGAAVIGEHYLASGTLYRYAALDRRALRANLARSGAAQDTVESAAQAAERAFGTAITYTLPAARRSRTGSAVLPTLAVAATCDEPLSAAAAFETPISAPAGPNAATALAAYLHHTDLRAGLARWIPPNGQTPPALPPVLEWR
ncbi:type I-E CRISPR-associated protein Cas7/Cse4/CasC [Streptomyces sp. BE20]|uniref:type I-E CRISPR-associated protein Cas7/Cse4/CasC n=1 Tax=Streptomyces sp. BE20 TaxID=3002525 RepID=UPI002E7677C1|nr:type I-E CRISPR-associated protein Cas7/Cse4/CasC [Streptomyces sp. BE20]MEE1823759.1 type I-E CRISPR-associated protein Cas7/Cse4/CasC [Streptomyces sp. BE20]